MLNFTTTTCLIQLSVKRGETSVGLIKDEPTGVTFIPGTGVVYTAEELQEIVTKMATLPPMPVE